MADIRTKLIVDTKDAKKSVDGLKSAFKGLLAAASVQQFVSLGDEFTQITNRLKSVSSSSAEASSAFNLVKKVAAETRSGLGPVADLFTDLTIATNEMGLSQQQVADVAGTFSKALKISGADANASAGAIRQFGQALASGVLRGDEFNSIMEANPTFMRKVASTLNVTTGQLRKMAEQGLLTSDVLVAATQEIGDSIDQDFAKTVSTVGEAFVSLKNAFIEIIGRIESNTGVFTGLANTIQHVADNLDVYIKLAAFAFGVAAVKGVMNFVKAIQALQIVTKAQAVAQAALLALSGPAGWGILAVAATATAGAVYGINTALSDTEEAAKDAINALEGGEKAAKDNEKTQRKVTTELEKQVDANKDGILQAAEIVELNKLLLEEQKKQKAQEDERARIQENQYETFKSITGELALGREELETQLDLQNSLFGKSDQQKALIQQIADLESQRADELRNLNDLTMINADDRLAKEKEINDEYDARTKLIKNQAQTLQDQALSNAISSLYGEQLKNFTAFTDELSRLQYINSGVTQDEIRNYDERVAATNEYNKKRIALNKEFLGDQINHAILLNMEYDMMTDDEKEAYDKRLEALSEYQNNFLGLLQQFQVERKDLEDEGPSTKFLDGFKEGFIEFDKQVKDSASAGKKIFNTLTQGWEDAILNFVETGKLSFKDLFKTMLQEAVKLFANKAFMALFSPSGMFGDLFAGFFDKGGRIPFGKIGITGERGPEFVRGPATVTSTADTAAMMGGRTYVTYNINAVDAPSFQALIARDPEFIYNVSRAGARRTPA